MSQMPNFDKIRQQMRDIITEHGGKIEINEWNASDGETMKVVMTFKALNAQLRTETVNSAAMAPRAYLIR